MAKIPLHPSIDPGVVPGAAGFSGGTLVCHCADRPVKVGVGSDALHNHGCVCTKCWKPVAFVSSVIEGGVDPSQMNVNRERLGELGVDYYDCLNPPLIEALATYAATQAA